MTVQTYKINPRKQTIYHSMILSESEIRSMVKECVGHILEYHHVVDSSFEKLADLIIQKFNTGGGEISADLVNSINPYFKTGKPLIVTPKDSVNGVAAYNPQTNEIEINTDPIFHRNGRTKESIMHELTHFLDDNKRTKPKVGALSFDKDSVNDTRTEFVNDILYYFNPSEIQARLTQYYYFLKQNPYMVSSDIQSYDNERVLKIGYMETLLEIANGATYGKPSEEIIQALAYAASYSRIRKREGHVGNSAYMEGMSEDEFNEQKNKITNILSQRLEKMKKKALKIKYDMMGLDSRN